MASSSLSHLDSLLEIIENKKREDTTTTNSNLDLDTPRQSDKEPDIGFVFGFGIPEAPEIPPKYFKTLKRIEGLNRSSWGILLHLLAQYTPEVWSYNGKSCL